MRTATAPSSSSEPQVGARRVVDDDRARGIARRGGAEHGLELARARPGARGRRRPGSSAVGRHPEPLELVDDGRERLLARVLRRAGQWQRARLDDDRGPAAAGDESASGGPESGKRSARRPRRRRPRADRAAAAARAGRASSSTVTSGSREPERSGMRGHAAIQASRRRRVDHRRRSRPRPIRHRLERMCPEDDHG